MAFSMAPRRRHFCPISRRPRPPPPDLATPPPDLATPSRRQAFDPTFASMHLTPAMVDDLMAIEPLAGHDLLDGLKQELPAYLSAAATCPALNRSDVGEYTEAVLAFYRAYNPRSPTWAKAARIIFAMAPSSAASERVFSLVKNMFGSAPSSNPGTCTIHSLSLVHHCWARVSVSSLLLRVVGVVFG